jgi:hypothetical protein
MSTIIISETQVNKIKDRIIYENNLERAKYNWSNMTQDEKKLVLRIIETLYPKKHKVLKEAWWNTVMDVLGLVDPTPIVDTVNAISYFIQGDTLFGILSLVSAIPYGGDAIAKPVTGALKIGSRTTKELEMALNLAKTGKTDKAQEILSKLANKPGPVGYFLKTAGGPNGWAIKINKFLDEIPFGVFKGMKKTIQDYFTLLGNAATKSKRLSKLVNTASKDLKPQTIQNALDLLKNDKIFDIKTLNKPGFFGQVFFGGIPRIFRSAEGRRLKIMMQQTKWWLGFLDYIGLGNWVGVDEAIKEMGGEGNFYSQLEKYQQTPDAKQYFQDSFQGIEGANVPPPPPSSQSSSNQNSGDPFSSFIRRLFLGQINPLPG